jgi:hypothetical protein
MMRKDEVMGIIEGTDKGPSYISVQICFADYMPYHTQAAVSTFVRRALPLPEGKALSTYLNAKERGTL